jgi:hypothetical protein
MKLIFFLIFTLWFSAVSLAQSNYSIQFLDYDSVIKKIKLSNSSAELKDKWNYLDILLLDNTEIKLIEKIRPDVVKDFRTNFSQPINEKKTINLKVTSIQNCFSDPILLEQLFSNTTLETERKDKNLDPDIYIKDNKVAVYLIYGTEWSECDRIRLTNEGIQIEMIYMTQD